MVLSNLVNKKKEHGFTLVELLIVIVVIAILAAITIVAYSGITARAYTSKSQTSAESAQKVAEAMNADNGYYPSLATITSAACTTALATPTTSNSAFTCGSTSTKLPSGMSIVPDNAGGTVMTSTTGTNGTTVAYSCLTSCTAAAGGRIAYWNYSTSAINYVYVGTATSGGTYVAPTS